MQTINKDKLNFVHLLRALATILVVNSHSDGLFPASLSFLGTGGSFGNAIFFFTSGYTLCLGMTNNNVSPLLWIYRRVMRIYPSVWLWVLVLLATLGIVPSFMDFFWPNSWFIQAILIFYPVFYVLMKIIPERLWLGIVGCAVFYCYVFYGNDHSSWIMDQMDNPTRLHWIYYFPTMLLGAICAQKQSVYIKDEMKNIILLGLSVILFYLPKYLISKHIIITDYQIIYPVFLYVSTYLFYSLAKSSIKYIEKLPKVYGDKIIELAGLTLDVYIVHIAFIYFFESTTLLFPANYLLAFYCVYVAAKALNFCAKKVQDFMINLIK